MHALNIACTIHISNNKGVNFSLVSSLFFVSMHARVYICISYLSTCIYTHPNPVSRIKVPGSILVFQKVFIREMSVAVISALDLDFLPGDFIDKIRDQQSPTPSANPSVNEDNRPSQAKRKQRPKKKKVQKKAKMNKMSQKKRKIVQTTTSAPEPRVLRKPDIKPRIQNVNPDISPRMQNIQPDISPRLQDVQYKNKNVTESYLLPSRNQFYQQTAHPNAISSSILDQIPLSALTHLLPEVRNVIESRNTIYSHRQTPETSQSSQQVPVAVHQPMLSNMVVNYKNQRTKLLPLTPSQFSRINNDPNRNVILRNLRDVLGAKPFSNTLHMNVKSGNRMTEARPMHGQNMAHNTIIDSSIPFQRKGLGPLKFFN